MPARVLRVLCLACVASLGATYKVSLLHVGQHNVARTRSPLMSSAGPDAASGGESGLDMGVLSRRLEEVRALEIDQQAAELLEAANNWRRGECAQKTLVKVPARH